MRESFIFYKSFYDALILAPEQDKYKIYDAIFNYQFTGEEPELDSPIQMMLWTLIKPNLDASNLKYTCAKKGGRPKKQAAEEEEKPQFCENEKPQFCENEKPQFCENEKPQFLKNKNHSFEKIKSNVNVNVNVDENVNVDVDVDENVNENEDTEEKIVNTFECTSDTKKLALDWIKYKKERGEQYKGHSAIETLIKKLDDAINKFGVAAVRDLVTQSMSNGYKGIIWGNLKSPPEPKNNKFHNFDQRGSGYYGNVVELLAKKKRWYG